MGVDRRRAEASRLGLLRVTTGDPYQVSHQCSHPVEADGGYRHCVWHRLRVTSEAELREVLHPFCYSRWRTVQLVAHDGVIEGMFVCSLPDPVVKLLRLAGSSRRIHDTLMSFYDRWQDVTFPVHAIPPTPPKPLPEPLLREFTNRC